MPAWAGGQPVPAGTQERALANLNNDRGRRFGGRRVRQGGCSGAPDDDLDRQRNTAMMRSMLREYYPAARVETALRKAGRQRNLTTRAAEMVRQTSVLEGQVKPGFGQHPDVKIYLSQPGLGMILGARVLAEFGDDPHRYCDTRARKNYSGMAPVTRASGTKRVVLARQARNQRLADALYQQAFAALTSSPGARAFYDRQRDRGVTHHQALRALANRLVGILHGCLTHQSHYDETVAWPAEHTLAA